MPMCSFYAGAPSGRAERPTESHRDFERWILRSLMCDYPDTCLLGSTVFRVPQDYEECVLRRWKNFLWQNVANLWMPVPGAFAMATWIQEEAAELTKAELLKQPTKLYMLKGKGHVAFEILPGAFAAAYDAAPDQHSSDMTDLYDFQGGEHVNIVAPPTHLACVLTRLESFPKDQQKEGDSEESCNISETSERLLPTNMCEAWLQRTFSSLEAIQGVQLLIALLARACCKKSTTIRCFYLICMYPAREHRYFHQLSKYQPFT